MTPARSLPENATQWWILLDVLVPYLLGRWFFARRQARREGSDRPGSAVLTEKGASGVTEAEPAGGSASYRRLFGLVGGTCAAWLITALTDGGLRVALLCGVVPPLMVAVSNLDSRQARKPRARA